MNPPADQRQDRWRTLMGLFEAAAELPPAERQAFLDSADCDSGVRQEVVELLNKLDTSSGSRAAARVSAPERIGRYVLIEPLGRGGMSEVFLAQDTELDRTVALKFLSVETFGGRPAVEVIVREAKTLSALNHPNIVTIHEVVQCGATFAIVMERVDGTPLRARIGDPLTPGQLASIGQQIAQALAAAHAAGIIHRDIKPENILIRTDGYVKVLDFGLARRINSETQSSTLGVAAGTLRYMSPEQTRSAPLTTATDVFSLGLVFYELATGRHPFGAASVFETAHAIATASAAAPSSVNEAIPPEQESLILSMLAKEPAARPSAAEVASLLGNTGGTAGSRRPRQQGLSRRWLVGSVAAGASLLGAGVYLRRRLSPGQPVEVLFDSGEADDPVFSPDGSRVAFSWKAPGEETSKIAVINISGGTPHVLTSGRVSDIDPAWSPDGRRVCFMRQGFGENALYVTPLEGGAEQRITTVHNSAANHRIDWLRDARNVVVSEFWYSLPMGVIDVETHARRDLPPPPKGSSDTSPKCSPDGNWIAFVRNVTHATADLFVVGVSGGTARRLTFDGAPKLEHCWTPNGQGILFKARRQNRWRFWHVPFQGGNSKEVLLPQVAVGSFDVRRGQSGGVDVVSADYYQVSSISRMEIPEAGQNPSRPMRMIASGDRGVNFEANPAISADGLKLAFVSTRTGSPEIWVADSEGQRLQQVTSFGGPEVTQPAWSPDGRYLLSACAPEGGRNLFLIDAETGSMRWLTFGGKEETEPQWSHDGQWITFASSRSGQQELWRMPAAGGAARRLTQNGGAVHRQSPDGRWIYYVRHEEAGLWRMPWGGGKQELVLGRMSSELYRAWAVGRRGVYYTYKDTAARKWTVLLYDPESRAERAVAVVERPLPRWSGTLTISPDERWMLLPIIEARGSRLLLFSGVTLPMA